MRGKTVKAKEITRIEGHLDLEVIISEDKVRAKAMAREGTRILEKVLIGRDYWEIPEIASRMCGVCNAIHKVTAVMAIENALGIEPSPDIQLIRELIVIGGHIQSHILHLFYFVLPDYLGTSSIINNIMRNNLEIVRDAMRVKKWANELVERFGGRAVHPVTPVVGGLSKLPTREDVLKVLKKLKDVKNVANRLVECLLERSFLDFPAEKNFVSLRESNDVPLLRGFVSICGENVVSENYLSYVKCVIEEYSTAPHFVLRTNESFMVGALARLNHNHENLTELVKELCARYNIGFPNQAVFANNQAQALEIMHFIEKAEEILTRFAEKNSIGAYSRSVEGKQIGIAVTEAPRGLLIHQYGINEDGKITLANIITPTAQNLKSIERRTEDLVKEFLTKGIDIENLRKEIEKLVRSYDPCLSCAARFKKIQQ
ncbi:MAG: Ni/Fe hydrogenase subunit alpha [Candidatus Njordarchaeales archaeon]